MNFRSSRLIIAALAMSCFTASTHAAGPRVAIWDPVQTANDARISFDPAAQKQALDWLHAASIETTVLNANQLSDAAAFSASQFDELILIGNSFPRAALPSLKKFAEDGGVLVSLEADVPFLITIEPASDGMWGLSPSEPKFAWQSAELLTEFGLKYAFKPDAPQQTVAQTVTPLLKKYLPDAKEVRVQPSNRWLIPTTNESGTGEIIPLLRDQRRDGADTPPAMFVARNGKRYCIVCTNPYTSDAQPKLWPYGRQTLLAIVQLAKDLRDGTAAPGADAAIQIQPDLPALPAVPLDRSATGSVEPDHAEPVMRWGAFDGSANEFGPPLAAGQSLDVAADAKADAVPACLNGGASVRLALPKLSAGPLYFRVRGAYTANGAALKVTLGDETILSESFAYIDASGPSNFNHNLVGVPAEFTRIAFIPSPTQNTNTLTLTNPGTTPIYFDAMQIERRSQPAPERLIGLGAGYDNHYPAEVSNTWTAMRTSLRTNLIGPPEDPDRFAKVDELLNLLWNKNAHLQPILEGTPTWAAISPERLADAEKAGRGRTVPPDPAKYTQLVKDILKHYGDRIDSYEIWNEADITQFYRGTPEEYVTLFKSIVPVIRAANPKAVIMATGMSGYRPPFLQKLLAGGVFDMADRIAFHPYSGKSPAWDMPFGQLQGTLMSWGVDKEIFCNESGFVFKNAEWFQPPPVFTPQKQAQLLSTAMARILACGLPKISVFNAGGDDNPYGLFDGNGKPRPAYDVFADYALLGQPGGLRLDVNIASPDGTPVRGVYAAATSYDDGHSTIVLNPAESDLLNPPEDPSPMLNGSAKWTIFFGQADFPKDKLQVTVAPTGNHDHAGFYNTVSVNPDQYPTVEVATSGLASDWELDLKTADGTAVNIVPRRGAGTVRVNYRDLLKHSGMQDLQVSFRIYHSTTIDAVRFLPATETPPAIAAIPIRVCVPLASSTPLTAELRSADAQSTVAVQIHDTPGNPWAELTAPLLKRTVIQLRPATRK